MIIAETATWRIGCKHPGEGKRSRLQRAPLSTWYQVLFLKRASQYPCDLSRTGRGWPGQSTRRPNAAERPSVAARMTHAHIYIRNLEFLATIQQQGLKTSVLETPCRYRRGISPDCEQMIVFKSQHKCNWKASNYRQSRHYIPPYSIQVSPGAQIRNVSHCSPPHSCLQGLSNAADTSACQISSASLWIAVTRTDAANCKHIIYGTVANVRINTSGIVVVSTRALTHQRVLRANRDV